MQLVEFEYHMLRPWPAHDLHEIVDWVEGLEYACFWQTNVGVLAPIVRGCTYPHWWSNVVCVYRGVPGLVAAMWSLVPKTEAEVWGSERLLEQPESNCRARPLSAQDGT